MCTSKRFLFFALAGVFIWVRGEAVAQPLVTGNLTLYYDFDEVVTNAEDERQFLDESGNNFHATLHQGDPDLDLEPGTLTVNNESSLRGAGAAHFQQSPNASDLPVYVDVHGEEITENFPERLATSGLNDQFGLSIAAWLNVTANDMGDQSVFQGRTGDGGHGAPHFQLQGNGKFRMTFRNQSGSTVVNAPQVFIDGTDFGDPYPVDEWFHYAGTYDADEGLWSMYYNGNQIATGESDGLDLGDWGGQEGDLFAAGFGAVYDSGGRRLDGLMDELYVFNRALSPEEVATLAAPPVMVPGDCNGDGLLDANDLACVQTLGDRDLVLAALNTLPGDLDGNGDVAFADFLTMSANFGEASAAYNQGNIDLAGGVEFADFLILSSNFGQTVAGAAAVPEPQSYCLAFLAWVAMAAQRRTRRRR